MSKAQKPILYLVHPVRFLLFCFLISPFAALFAQENNDTPIIIDSDTVEYGTTDKEVSASGNVQITYKGSKLTCDRIKVNTETKEGVASGHARLEDQRGIVEGETIIYNFQTKRGTIIDANFRSNPYFGSAKRAEKLSDAEFIAESGYVTTCNFDKPHYRIDSKEVKLFPGDKIQSRSDTLYIGKTPIAHLPVLNRSLKKSTMHGDILPGKRKDWGPYLLAEWQYNINRNLDARLYLDYRTKLGPGEGAGLNYNTKLFGKGDIKFYYTDEKPNNLPSGFPREYKRYLARLRHRWEIDRRTNIVAEVYKIRDDKRKLFDAQSNFLKDYFYREFEKDAQPLTYILFHHNFNYSSLDILSQKRLNHWYDQLDKFPEAKYSLPGFKVGDTPFYFENQTSAATYNKKASTAPATADDQTVSRLDTYNKISMPMRVAFVNLTPFVADRETLYDKGADGKSTPVRTIFYSGADLSTKFYRIFNVKSNFLNMDLNGLRHIITPTVGYAYNHTPTIPAANLRQIDSVDSIATSNSFTLGLSNKLQTKRKNQSVDIVDFLVTTSYIFNPKGVVDQGDNFSDVVFDLKLLPYSFLRLQSKATYTHSGSRTGTNYGRFTDVNYDVGIDLGKGRSLGFGQRYQRKGGNQLTGSFSWRLNSKWSFSVYERYNIKTEPNVTKGLQELEYTFSRDLHCWTVDLTLRTGQDGGSSFYVVFRSKAFPESEFGFEQLYHKRKSGSQSNP